MDLSVLQIEIVQAKSQGFSDPHTGAQEEKDQGSIPDVVNHQKKFLHIGGMHGARQDLRELERNPPFEKRKGNEVLFHQEMQKSNQAGQSRPHRGDPQSSVLLRLDESLQVGPFQGLEVSLARLGIEVEKKPNRGKGTAEGSGLVVQTPLVAQVMLEVIFGGKFDPGEFVKELVNRTLFKMALASSCACTLNCFIVRCLYLSHVSSSSFSRKSR